MDLEKNKTEKPNNQEAKGENISPIVEKQIISTINNIPILRNFVENLPYNPRLEKLAREKRKLGILSEVLFWQKVHKTKFYGIDFDRQRIIGNYIVDFYVKTLGLIIEIDGSSHNDKIEYDAIREAYLKSFGLRMYRISDISVKKNLQEVMQALAEYIVQEYGDANFSLEKGDDAQG